MHGCNKKRHVARLATTSSVPVNNNMYLVKIKQLLSLIKYIEKLSISTVLKKYNIKLYYVMNLLIFLHQNLLILLDIVSWVLLTLVYEWKL
jgi:hypothetical protein